jgi:hypothetical protein
MNKWQQRLEQVIIKTKSKPYFAKYLPKGELKSVREGDMIQDSSGKIRPALRDGRENDVTNVKPVKLFLCSRDIQVGDSVFCPDGNNPTKEWTVIESVGDATASNQISIHLIPKGAYKVIGEISPDATWVKEGDEFSEYRWIWEPGEDMDTEYLTDERKAKLPANIRKYINIIAVMGPCGHFH